MAAGVVIVSEAGGKVTAYDGSNQAIRIGRVLASNGYIHNEMMLELAKAKPLQKVFHMGA
jgi:myo-inositol-1(or 4)-monophosphatase